MVASGEPVDRQQLASIASTAAKLSDAAMNTAAAALGIDDLMEAIAPDVDDEEARRCVHTQGRSN